MGVGIDAEDAAEFEPPLMPPPVKVQSPRIGVDLHGNAMIRARLEDFLDIDVITDPAQELTACHMPEYADERIGDGAQQTLRLLLAVHPELPMDAGHDEIESPQDVVGVIERSVRQNVGFDALEDAKAS